MAVFPVEKTPLTIPGCLVWLDFSDPSTITSSSNLVSAVKNKANSLVTFTQATGASQPTTSATTVNGLNVLSFSNSGAGTGLDSASGIFNTNTPFTIFCTAQINNTTTFGNLMAQGSGGSAQGYMFSNSVAYPSKKLGTQVGGSQTTTTNIPNAFNVFSLTYNGSLVSMLINGVSGASASATPASNTNAITIGNANGYSFGLLGTMGDVLIYNRYLSTSEQTSINRYLANKWGIAI